MQRKKLVVISHAYILPMYQKKIEEMALFEEFDIVLITPTKSIEGGGQDMTVSAYEGTLFEHKVLPAWLDGRPNSYRLKGLDVLLQELSPDVILLEEEYWTNIASQVVNIRKKFLPDTKLVLLSCENICHAWESEAKGLYQKLRYGVFHRVEQQVVPELDGLIFQFECVWKTFHERMAHLGFDGLKGAFPQLGVDPEYFLDVDSDKVLAVKQEHGLVTIENDTIKRSFVFGYIGRIIKDKGVEDLLRAFVEMYLPGMKLILVGNGDEEYIAKLKRFVNSNGVGQHVVFVPAVPLEDVPVYLNSMDVMLLLSHTTPEWKEQFGRVLIEAMAAGTVVIGSNSGAIPSVIKNAGVIVEEGNHKSIEKAMKTVYKDRNLQKMLRSLGSQRVKKEFSYRSIARQTIEFLDQVVDVDNQIE